MEFVEFKAYCPYQIGDKVFVESKKEYVTITDIACVQYVSSKDVKFIYELNCSGKYVSFVEQ